MLELEETMQDNCEALRKLNPKSSWFDKRVSELARQQGELVTQKIIQRNQVRAKVFAILTPEQREKAKKMKRNHFGAHGKHGGNNGRMGS
jgi:Spy/CpxP family protein refolding chaperone